MLYRFWLKAVFGIALPIAAELSITESTGYLEILRLSRTAKFALTDSGGLQEETTYLGIPCLTLRDNTERPVTIDGGTNVLTGSDPSVILKEYEKIMNGDNKKGTIPDLWDGHTAKRIVEIITGLP